MTKVEKTEIKKPEEPRLLFRQKEMDSLLKEKRITLVMNVGEKKLAKGDKVRIDLLPVRPGSNHSIQAIITAYGWKNRLQNMARMTIELCTQGD